MPLADPESFVFHRRLTRRLPVAVRGEGSWLIDAEGRRYLDAAGGAMVASLGHDLQDVADAVREEIARLGYVNGTQFTHRSVEELAAELGELLPSPLRHSYFLSSGSEAIEAAVKLARQLWVERGLASKWKVISRVPSYHGNTLAALALSGREHYRRVYGPLLTSFPRIPAPDPYRHPDSPASTGAALEEAILREGPETVAAFLFEPIGGSTTGATVPTAEYVRTVFETCRRHGVLVIADEVLCGMGRTGRWFAFQHFGRVPDILVLGKGLNAGALPLSAVVTSAEIVQELAEGSGTFNHAQTYSHHTAACAAGLAVVRRLRRERLVEQAARLEPWFFGALDRVWKLPQVGDIRGRGLLAGVELVQDRETREPFPRAARVAERLTERAFEQGLIVWPNVGHVDGERGDIVMLGPPLTVGTAELEEIGSRLARALAEV